MTLLVYSFNDKRTVEVLLSLNKTNLLVSYYYLSSQKGITDLLSNIKNKIDEFSGSIFILDSGAFSAWNRGKIIHLYDYIDFIKKYHSYFTHIVCLDVIDNPVISEVNHLIMQQELKDFDLTIIPVFHSGEPFSVLDYMVQKGYKYLGISPNNNWTEKNKRKWLHRVYSRHDFEKLGIQTHGFGYQSIEGLSYFPFTTCDATTWKIASGFGEIIDPTILTNRVKYSLMPSSQNMYHVDNLGGHTNFVLSVCNSLHINPDILRSDYKMRDLFNIEALSRLTTSKKEFPNSSIEIFSEGDNQDFSEKEVLKQFELCINKGRCFTGVPQETIPTKYTRKTIRKSKSDTLF